MNIHALVPYVFLAIFVAFAIWSVFRGRRWEKYQADAAQRSKAILEAASADRGRFEEVMSVSREQLQVARELLAETKALREDLARDASRRA